MDYCELLLKEYRQKNTKKESTKLIFKDVEPNDVYNVTAPFETREGLVIAGRVEARDSEDSKVMFFTETKENTWCLIKEAPVFKLQDPFITKIKGQLVLGGVEVFPKKNQPDLLDWRTCFYKGNTLKELELFFEGPIGMKDIRLKELENGQLLLLTRPQGEKGGRGKIGVSILNTIRDLTIEAVEAAPLIENQFTEGEWGGANEIHQLDENTVGILGHIANFDKEGDRHYYSMIFKLNLKTLEASPLKIIAERKDFIIGESKRPDLRDVVFSGGMIRRNDQMSVLYVGTSDAEAQKIIIEDPFLNINR